MGKRGPAPSPSIIKYIRGNPEKQRLNTSEPTPDLLPENIVAPAWLEGLALQKWNESAPILSRMRVLTEADVETFARYCAMWERWKMAYDRCKSLGDEITHLEPDPNRTDGKLRIKYTQVAPWASAMKNIGRDLLRIEQEFGLTPSSRSQVTIHANRADDPLVAFISSRGDRKRG